MKIINAYLVFCALVTIWLVHAQYSGKVLWAASAAVARHYSDYQHK